jgi:hypothetical protein
LIEVAHAQHGMQISHRCDLIASLASIGHREHT